MRRLFALLFVGILAVILPRDALAGSPGLWPYPWGGVYSPSVRGLPPYFSLYPPVYYSYPVPRTYGYSPYAYPAGTPTPEVIVEVPQAKLMVNPYVPKSQPTAKTRPEKTAGGPLLIVNPYVEAKLKVAGNEITEIEVAANE